MVFFPDSNPAPSALPGSDKRIPEEGGPDLKKREKKRTRLQRGPQTSSEMIDDETNFETAGGSSDNTTRSDTPQDLPGGASTRGPLSINEEAESFVPFHSEDGVIISPPVVPSAVLQDPVIENHLVDDPVVVRRRGPYDGVDFDDVVDIASPSYSPVAIDSSSPLEIVDDYFNNPVALEDVAGL